MKIQKDKLIKILKYSTVSGIVLVSLSSLVISSVVLAKISNLNLEPTPVIVEPTPIFIGDEDDVSVDEGNGYIEYNSELKRYDNGLAFTGTEGEKSGNGRQIIYIPDNEEAQIGDNNGYEDLVTTYYYNSYSRNYISSINVEIVTPNWLDREKLFNYISPEVLISSGNSDNETTIYLDEEDSNIELNDSNEFTLTFGWGSHFNYENPMDFYVSDEANGLSYTRTPDIFAQDLNYFANMISSVQIKVIAEISKPID